MRPRLLDLFCKAGGAGWGYHDAGFEVNEYLRAVEIRRLGAEMNAIKYRGDGRELASYDDELRAQQIDARLAELGGGSHK